MNYFDSKRKSIKYFEEQFNDIDVDAKNLEKAFTNKKHYLAMKILPLQKKEVLYYSIIKNYSLNKISELMKLSKKEIIQLKEIAIADFKENLKKIGDSYYE